MPVAEQQYENFADLLVHHPKTKALWQYHAAEVLGVSRQYVTLMKRGTVPGRPTLHRMADVLSIDADELRRLIRAGGQAGTEADAEVR